MTTTPVATSASRSSGVTAPSARRDLRARRQVLTTSVMGLALLVVVLHAVVGILPDAPVVWVLTPDRLVLLVGLAAGLVAAPSPREWATWLDLPIVLLVAASAASAVASGQGWPVWRALLTGVMTCYLAVGLMRRHPSSWTLVTGSALVACAVTGLTALHQWADDVPTGFCRAGLAAGRELCSDPDAMVRVTGTFGNPNVLAAALVLLLPVAWAGATSLPTSSARLVGYAVVVLGYVAVLLTWSRAGVAAAVVGATVLVVLRPGWSRRVSTAVAAAVVIGGVLVVGGSLGVRRDVWGAALRVVAGHPLGVGPGRSGAVIDQQVPGPERFRHAHDLWLSWTLEGGWLAGAAVVALTLGAVWLVRRGVRSGSTVARVAGAGLAGFAVMSLVDHPANTTGIATLLWLLLGLVAGVGKAGVGKAGARESRPVAPPRP